MINKIFMRRLLAFLEDLLYLLIMTFSLVIALSIFLAALGPYFLQIER